MTIKYCNTCLVIGTTREANIIIGYNNNNLCYEHYNKYRKENKRKLFKCKE